ncbi:MAG: hypothetical protein WCD72_09060 [Dehalococcoidia bacterium]
MNKTVMCPKCGAECDMISGAASKTMGGLCAVCWSDRHEKEHSERVESGKPEEVKKRRRTES